MTESDIVKALSYLGPGYAWNTDSGVWPPAIVLGLHEALRQSLVERWPGLSVIDNDRWRLTPEGASLLNSTRERELKEIASPEKHPGYIAVKEAYEGAVKSTQLLRSLMRERDQKQDPHTWSARRERAAVALWRLFGPAHRMEWENEPHQDEYRKAVDAMLDAYNA